MVPYQTDCVLCSVATPIVWQDDAWRLVRTTQRGWPVYYQLILNDHVSEMTDLANGDRERCFQLMWHVESTVRDIFRPDKMNIASLGNMVPHLHWHFIGRYAWDPTFPGSFWQEEELRPLDESREALLLAAVENSDEAIASHLDGLQ
ncbi:HIT family protein [Nocardioides sp.]|uniref:HIT family protein n=1 Tax=Nocardioides sp. TaxID=35761 RepID=UPI003514CA76